MWYGYGDDGEHKKSVPDKWHSNKMGRFIDIHLNVWFHIIIFHLFRCQLISMSRHVFTPKPDFFFQFNFHDQTNYSISSCARFFRIQHFDNLIIRFVCACVSVLRTQMYTKHGIVQQNRVLCMHNATLSYYFWKNSKLNGLRFSAHFLFQKTTKQQYESRVFVTIIIVYVIHLSVCVRARNLSRPVTFDTRIEWDFPRSQFPL